MADAIDTDNLDELLGTIWQTLAASVRGTSPLRTPIVSTIGLDGSPQARTVVLRAVDAQTRTLTFWADARSPKIGEIKRDPRVAWTFYDAQTQVQIRATAVATVHVGDALTNSVWPRVPAANRTNYRSLAMPGETLMRYDENAVGGSDGGEHFAVVQTRVSQLDWLWIRSDVHRRARFLFDASRSSSRWVAP